MNEAVVATKAPQNVRTYESISAVMEYSVSYYLFVRTRACGMRGIRSIQEKRSRYDRETPAEQRVSNE